MLSRRRLALQLTPLLDLLLIVMFSQYIENRDRSLQAQEEIAEQRTKADAEIRERREALEREFARQQKSLDDLRAVYDDRFRNIIEQHHQAGTLLAESLNLPGVAMTEILKLRTANSPDDAERLSVATTRVKELMQARGEDVFRFLIKVDQMQKHVSVWEVHVLENGKAQISNGEQSFTADYQSETDFAARLFEHSKSFADPRTLVIMLLSWGDAQGGARQRATNGMPILAEQLRKDAAGIRWYDFSIVGFRADGPIFNSVAK
jgi:hypothetical protein